MISAGEIIFQHIFQIACTR